LTPETLNKILDFLQKHFPHYIDRNTLKEHILKHLEYKTILIVMNKDEVIAVCRWNVKGEVADILDLAIDEKFRKKGLIKELLHAGLKLFPYVKYLSYERQAKYPFRDKKLIPIDQF